MSFHSKGGPRRTLAVGCSVFLVLAFVLMSVGALAQSETPKAEIFAGFSFMRLDDEGASALLPTDVSLKRWYPGWNAELQINANRWFGIVADFSGHYGTPLSGTGVAGLDIPSVHFYNFLFGPVVTYRGERFQPFVHALFGVNRASVSDSVFTPGGGSDSAFAIALGGGLDVKLSRHVAFRLIQMDLLRTNHDPCGFLGGPGCGFDDHQNNLRFSTGLVFLLGGGPPPVPPSCSVSANPSEVYAGEPVRVTASGSNFNPKRTLSYSWSANGGKLEGKDTSGTVDTTGLNPGSYTVTSNITDGRKGTAQCTASFAVKERPKHPPEVSCSANPATVQSGTPSTITVDCKSSDNMEVSVGSWSSSSGKLSGSGNTATLDTAGAGAGPITVSAVCTDSRGLSTNCSATVNMEVPPPPLQASKLNECAFPNEAKPGRVDNTCKAVLDDVALRLQRDADSKAVFVGYSDAEEKGGARLAAQRAINSKAYVTTEKGIDPSRIETRTGSGGGKKAEYWVVPAGVTFSEAGTEVVTEPVAPVRHRAAKKKAAPAEAAPAEEAPAKPQ